tara:strand:+ start:166 stop:318 length:153 start_codon:yes stop_codon:yes gene_type:complete
MVFPTIEAMLMVFILTGLQTLLGAVDLGILRAHKDLFRERIIHRGPSGGI